MPNGTQSILMLYNDLVNSTLFSRVGVINICSNNDPFHEPDDVILASQMAVSWDGPSWSRSQMAISNSVSEIHYIISRENHDC